MCERERDREIYSVRRDRETKILSKSLSKWEKRKLKSHWENIKRGKLKFFYDNFKFSII